MSKKKTRKEKPDLFAGYDENELLIMNGYDDCIIGIVEQFGRPQIVCYDQALVIKKLQKDGMTYEEAVEFWSYNQLGAYVSEANPCFLIKNK